MGNKVLQRILECSHCGRTPEDGEPMWDMSSEGYICEHCIDLDRDEEEEREYE